MPFKDIDLDKLRKQSKIENEVLKQVTINNKLNTSTLNGYRDKLNAIELVTGQTYDVPSFSDRVKQEEELRPINMQLNEIKSQLAENQPHQQPQIEYRNPNAEHLRQIYISLLGDDINLNTKADINAAIQQIGDSKRRILDKGSQRYKDLFALNEYLKGYRTANYPDQQRRRLPSAPPSVQMQESDEQEGEGLFTSVNEIVERLKVLIGEMTSGNKNVKLKNEANDILEYLLRSDKIDKQQYLKAMDIISNL